MPPELPAIEERAGRANSMWIGCTMLILASMVGALAAMTLVYLIIYVRGVCP